MNPESQASDKPSPETPLPKPVKSRFRSWLPVIVLLAVFLTGFVPRRGSSPAGSPENCTARDLSEQQRTQLQLTLAYAALDARRGEYESARQGAASFFSLVAAELDRGFGSALPSNARAELQPLLAERDDLITLLARGDAASAERLANAIVSVRKMFDQDNHAP